MWTSGREEWKQCSWRQCWNFGQSVSADDVHDWDISSRVDDDSREVEETVLDGAAKDQRCDVLSIWTERHVVSRLVVRRGRRAARRDHRLFHEVVQADYITTVSAGVVTECHTTRPITRIERNKQPYGRVVKQCLQHRTSANAQRQLAQPRELPTSMLAAMYRS